MRKRVLATLLTVGMTASLWMTGCGSVAQNTQAESGNTEVTAVETQAEGTSETENPESAVVTFTDDLGREITVENPQRVASLLGSFADIWYLAGGEIIASADDAWDDFDLPLPEDAVNLGNTKTPNLEELFESDPDFVVASTNTARHMELKDTLEAAGVNVAYFDVSDFDDYLRVLKIFTDITGREDLYEQNGASIQEQMQKIVDESKKHIDENGKAPKVLVIRASASMILAKNSKNNVMGEMLYALGCENIADSDSSLLENLSIEHIIVEDPEYIFICQFGDNAEAIRANVDAYIAENPAWNGLKAVEDGRVYYMEKALYTLKPNDRWAEAYEKVEKLLFHE